MMENKIKIPLTIRNLIIRIETIDKKRKEVNQIDES